MKKFHINLRFSIQFSVCCVALLALWIFVIVHSFVTQVSLGGKILIFIAAFIFIILCLIGILILCYHRGYLIDERIIYKTLVSKKTIQLNSNLVIQKTIEFTLTNGFFVRRPFETSEMVTISDGSKKIKIPYEIYVKLNLNLPSVS